jgi:hypothetical protein
MDLWGEIRSEIGRVPGNLDDAGRKTIESFKKHGAGRANRILVDDPNGEYVCAQADTEYVLQSDMVSPTFGIRIAANNVTVNLNDRRITYQTVGMAPEGAEKTYGVGAEPYITGCQIVNGVIVQGNGAGAGVAAGYGVGCNPIGSRYGSPFELVGGCSLEWHTADTGGLVSFWNYELEVAHCTFLDTGTDVTDRHSGVGVVFAQQARIHRCRVLGARHQTFVVSTGSVVENNECYADTRGTNGFTVGFYRAQRVTVRHNNIYSVGEHPMGIALHSDGCQENVVYGNWIECQTTRGSGEFDWNYAVAISDRWGVRTAENYVHDNVCITHARDNFDGQGTISRGRTLFLAALGQVASERFENNIFASFNTDGTSEAHPVGIGGGGANPNLVMRGNRFISNYDCTLTGEGYGAAPGYARFIDNSFERVDAHSTFVTHRSTYSTAEVDFVSNDYVGGAAIDDLAFNFDNAWGYRKDARFGWNVTVTVRDGGTPRAGAIVTAKDNTGSVLAVGTTDASGVVVLPVVCYRRTTDGAGGAAGGATVDLRAIGLTATIVTRTGTASVSPTSDTSVTIDLP